MGNYTWIFKCVSNISTTEPTIDIIEIISRQYENKGWWFHEWLETLSETHSNLVHNSATLPTNEFKQALLNDPTFPRKISMMDSVPIFYDRKLYGYIDDDLLSFLNDFGQCLPENAFMMMLGIYEGFGPVALGWVNGKFVSMMGFEHRCFGGSDLLNQLNKTQEEFMSQYDDDDDKDYQMRVMKEYRQMMLFKKEVIDPLETINWSTETDDIISWLGRRGFETDSRSTETKQCRMMGCTPQ